MTDSGNPNLILGKYSIRDLVDIERLRGLFEEFSLATGFTTGFVSYPDHEILIATGWREICTRFHRACPDSERHCDRAWDRETAWRLYFCHERA
ncbi:MAG: PocR ligand-binding domain-containing protein [Planctomycetota bacterium]